MTVDTGAVKKDANTDALAKAEAEAQCEIDKILNEVEGLRRELTGETGAEASPAQTEAHDEGTPNEGDDLLKEFQASFTGGAEAPIEDGGMEATLADLKEVESNGQSLLDEELDSYAENADEALVNAAVAPGDGPRLVRETAGAAELQAGTLTIAVSGSMSLRLKYEHEGQEVLVGFDEGCLKISLSDGAEFKIPVTRKSGLRRVS